MPRKKSSEPVKDTAFVVTSGHEIVEVDVEKRGKSFITFFLNHVFSRRSVGHYASSREEAKELRTKSISAERKRIAARLKELDRIEESP